MQFCYRCPCYNYNYHSIKRAGRFDLGLSGLAWGMTKPAADRTGRLLPEAAAYCFRLQARQAERDLCTQPPPSCIHTTQPALITYLWCLLSSIGIAIGIDTDRKHRHSDDDVVPFSGQNVRLCICDYNDVGQWMWWMEAMTVKCTLIIITKPNATPTAQQRWS